MKPWVQLEKLLKVYYIIFSSKEESLESLKWAKNQLLLWQIKDSQFEFNSEIDATLSLLSALIQDKQMKLQPNHNLDNLDLRSFYSIAIVKFCNILPYYKFCSANQIKRVFTKLKRSSNETGRELNLPDWLIECRHNICHSYGTSLILLRQANYLALAWLKKNFWSKLIKNEIAQDQENLINLQSVLNQLLECKVPRRRRYLYRIFNRQLSHNPVKTFDTVAFTIISGTCSILNESNFANCKIPHQILSKYQRLISISTIDQSVLLLFDSLVYYFNDPNQKKVNTAALWLITLINSFILDENLGKPFHFLKHRYDKNDSDYSKIMWIRLLYKICQNLNQYTFHIINLIEKVYPNILPFHHLEALKKISYTMTNYQDISSSTFSFKNNDDYKTVKDLKAMGLKLGLMKTEKNQDRINCFSFASN